MKKMVSNLKCHSEPAEGLDLKLHIKLYLQFLLSIVIASL